MNLKHEDRDHWDQWNKKQTTNWSYLPNKLSCWSWGDIWTRLWSCVIPGKITVIFLGPLNPKTFVSCNQVSNLEHSFRKTNYCWHIFTLMVITLHLRSWSVLHMFLKNVRYLSTKTPYLPICKTRLLLKSAT